ncbi:MAG TPA: transposase [Kofleriaceae bacterium]|jgi:REP element-mobilizing transposase RayT
MAVINIGEFKQYRVMQMQLFPKRGGKRRGAGRPAKGPRPSERHEKRARVTRHTPVHVTLRVVELRESLRTRELYRAIRAATIVVGKKQTMRVVHASVQSNHVHLIVEAEDQRVLAKGMQGFQISAAKHINRTLVRKGTVFRDRYHAHVLKTPREARNAVVYVLNNWRKHGVRAETVIDPCSSADCFDGWREGAWEREEKWRLRVFAPASWLLRKVTDVSVLETPRR